MTNSTYAVGVASGAGQRQTLLPALTGALAALAATSSFIGLLAAGGPGRQLVKTARGATVTLWEGLYAADTWLIGAGNRGQDLAMLIFELPVLLLILRWYRRVARWLQPCSLACWRSSPTITSPRFSALHKTGCFRFMSQPQALPASRSSSSPRD